MKPLLMTKAHIEKYYNLSEDESTELCAKLGQVGVYLRKDNPLFTRAEVEKGLADARHGK